MIVLFCKRLKALKIVDKKLYTPYLQHTHIRYIIYQVVMILEKKTYRTDEEKKIINNRINRIEGQLRGVKKMISEDAYCRDVLIQLSAIENSVKSLSNHVLEKHLYTCVTRDLENGDLEVIDELINLFKKFNN